MTRTAVVTASDSGIGRATAVALASYVADGGMLQMGPQAASELATDGWRSA